SPDISKPPPQKKTTKKKTLQKINPHQRGVIPIQYTIQTATRYRPVWQGAALSLSRVETAPRSSLHHHLQPAPAVRPKRSHPNPVYNPDSNSLPASVAGTRFVTFKRGDGSALVHPPRTLP